MVGMFHLAWGFEGEMPPYAFNLLVLVEVSFIKINQVNSVLVERPHKLKNCNNCCGVAPSECTTK
jgi:hypothetical protein